MISGFLDVSLNHKNVLLLFLELKGIPYIHQRSCWLIPKRSLIHSLCLEIQGIVSHSNHQSHDLPLWVADQNMNSLTNAINCPTLQFINQYRFWPKPLMAIESQQNTQHDHDYRTMSHQVRRLHRPTLVSTRCGAQRGVGRGGGYVSNLNILFILKAFPGLSCHVALRTPVLGVAALLGAPSNGELSTASMSHFGIAGGGHAAVQGVSHSYCLHTPFKYILMEGWITLSNFL